MDDTYIDISYGDHASFAQDEDGFPAVRIDQLAFVEPPRWITCTMATGYDRTSNINELIWALEKLRDAKIGE